MSVLFTINADHPCLAGHFPGNPIVPGVVILDHVMQAIEDLAGTQTSIELAQVKFIQMLLPEQEANIVVEQLSSIEAMQRYRFKVMRDETMLVSGEIKVPHER